MIAQPQGRVAVNPQTGERVVVAGPAAAQQARPVAPPIQEIVPSRPRPTPPPSGYQPAPGGLTYTPGGPADPSRREPPSGYQPAPGGLAPTPGGPAAANERNTQFDNISRIRDQFRGDPEIRSFGRIRNAFDALNNFSNDPDNPFGDVATVFAFMKALDPDSAVREGEQATFANAPGVSEGMRSIYNSIIGQGRISRESYEQVLSAARGMYEPRATYFNEEGARYRQMLRQQGVPEDQLATHIPFAPTRRGGEMGAILDEAATTADPEAAMSRMSREALPQNPETGPLDGVTRTEQSTGNQEWGTRTPDNASATRAVPDPALRGHATRLGQMLANPRTPDEQIRAYVAEYFPWNAGQPLIESAIRDRRDPRSELGRWIRSNRGKPVVMGDDWWTRQEERPNAERNLGMLLDSGPGAATAHYFNGVTAGLVPPAAEAIGAIDDANNARAGLAGLRESHPGWSMAGDIAGVVTAYAGGRGALGAVAPNLAARASARPLASGIAGDALYGGVRGAAENPDDPLWGAAQGAAVNAAVGAGARGGVRVGSNALAPTGGAMAPLYAEGVQPSMGQRAGGVVNRAEQAFASVPVLGAAQRGTRERAIEQFERSVFNRALRNIPEARTGGRQALLPDGVGPGAQAWDHTYRAFDQAYDSVHSQMRFRLDGRVQQSLVQAQRQAARLHPDSAQRFTNILDNDVTRVLAQNGGQLSGRDLQGVLSNIRSTIRSVGKNPNGDQEFVAALEGLEDALMRGAIRHSPRDAIRDLRRIDRGYAQLMRAERAAMSGSANRAPGRFSATDLQRAERATGNRRRFLRGDQEGANYAEAGQRLGQNVADSGTGERAAYMAGGLGMVGGPGAGAALTPWSLSLIAPYAVNTIGNLPGVRQGVNALLQPRTGPRMGWARDNMQRFGEPLAGASAPAVSDPWYGSDY